MPGFRAKSVGQSLIAWEMNTRTRRFTRVSGRAEAILGYPVERWRSVPGFWIGVLHPEDRERVAHAVWRMVREQQPCEIEYRAVAADGSVVRIRDRVKVVPDAEGGIVLQGAMVDLTERVIGTVDEDARPRRWRRGRYRPPTLPDSPRPDQVAVVPPPVQRPVAGAEPPIVQPVHPVAQTPPPTAQPPEPHTPALFAPDRLFAAIGEAVIASDADHRIVYWSAAAETLLGYSPDSAIGMLDSELLQTRTSAGQTADIVSGLVGNRPWSAQVEVHDRDGVAIPVRITASALRNNGVVAGFVAVVTDLRQVQRDAAARAAGQAMDAVARLASGVAHEINEGVARMEAAIRKTLARVEPGSSSRVHLDEALRTVDSTAALGTQLLAVGRQTSIVRGSSHLADVVRRGLPAIRLLAGSSIEVAVELDATTPPAMVDPAIASQVIMNLAVNACAAMPDGGRLVIATSMAGMPPPGEPAADDAAWVQLEMRDTRPPVETAVLDHFFEPFNESVVPPGMGLAAAHGLVTLSNGHIRVAAQPDGGLVVRVLFRADSADGGKARSDG